MKKNLNAPFNLIVIFFLLLIGCDEEINLCPEMGPKTKNNPAKIDRVNFFIEISGSMSGFMPMKESGTDFQILIPDIISSTVVAYTKSNFFKFKDGPKPLNQVDDIQKFRADISNGTFNWGATSSLPVMIDSAIKKCQQNEVSVLVTDAIYSPPPKSGNIGDQMITDIKAEIVKAKSKNLATKVLMFKSRFKQTVSPYYLIIIGKTDNIKAYTDLIEKSSKDVSINLVQKDMQQFEAGFNEYAPYYSLLPFFENQGNSLAVSCSEKNDTYLGLDDVQFDIGNVPTCWVALDLKALPNYATETFYLKRNLVLENELAEVYIDTSSILSNNIEIKITDEITKQIAKKATHFVKVKIKGITGIPGQISFGLKKVEPAWIKLNSHTDYVRKEEIRNQTYGLDNLYAGITAAYNETEEMYYFKGLKILVKQAD